MAGDLDLTAFLREVGLFQGLPDEDLGRIAAIGQLERRGARETIFREGEAGDCMYVIVQGKVDILRDVDDGEPLTLVTMGRGEIFGEMALFDDVRRSAGARVFGKNALLLRLGRDLFTALCRRNVEIPLHLIARLNRRVRELTDHLVDTDRMARRYAPTLEELIEEEYPHPVAVVHQEMDAAGDPGTKLRRALELLEAVLLYVGAVCRALYVGTPAASSEINADLVLGQKGATLGQLQKTIRLVASHLVEEAHMGGLAAEIRAWLGAKVDGGNVSKLLGEVTELRNSLKHGSEAALDADACEKLLAGLLPKMRELCASIDFLRKYPLVHVHAMTFSEGAFRYTLHACRGAFRSFRSEAFVHNEPLETHRLYVLDGDRSRPVLLHPFAAMHRCATCGDREIFLTQKWSDKRIESIELGRGHRHLLQDPGTGVARLIEKINPGAIPSSRHG
jgi:CRP-like cAMP-binding protein